MIDDRIRVGDMVSVYFNNSKTIFRAIVMNRPRDTGDTWCLKSSIDHSTVFEVQQFDFMERIDAEAKG